MPERPDYNYLRDLFRYLRKELDVPVTTQPKKLPIVPTEIDDALIQYYSGHESRKSLEVYSRLSIQEAQKEYNDIIGKFPV